MNPAKVKPDEVPAFLAERVAGEGTVDVTEHVLRVLESQGIEVLIPIGGDDTLSYGLRMHEEGFPVVAIPKTMDNDVHGTDYCIGFSTAVTRGVQFIHQLRTSAGSHRADRSRRAVRPLQRGDPADHRVPGRRRPRRHLGGAVRHRLAGGAARGRQEGEPLELRDAYDLEGATLAGEMVRSGEADAYGHQKLGGIGQLAGELLREKTGEGIIYQQVAYLMLGQPGLARPDGGDELRGHGRRAGL